MNTSKTIPAILTERQIFYISEFDVEAAWLSFMHREGWKMLSTTGFKYRFESCPKENWTYQLDFRADGVSEEEYIQMYADYGWEFVTRFRQWYYFRKPYSEEEDMSIFSDNADVPQHHPPACPAGHTDDPDSAGLPAALFYHRSFPGSWGRFSKRLLHGPGGGRRAGSDHCRRFRVESAVSPEEND